VNELTRQNVDIKALFSEYASTHGIQNTSLQALIALLNDKLELSPHVQESLIDKVLRAIKRAEDAERRSAFQSSGI